MFLQEGVHREKMFLQVFHLLLASKAQYRWKKHLKQVEYYVGLLHMLQEFV